MLNFAAQAARDCRRIESDLRAHGYRDDAATAGGLADRIAAAEHFQLPDGGYLFDDDLDALTGLALRLPFPLTTIEFIARDPAGRTLRRMGLCSEFQDESGALAIRVVAFARDEGRWGIVPVAIDFSADDWEKISADCTPFCEFAADPALAPPDPAVYGDRLMQVDANMLPTAHQGYPMNPRAQDWKTNNDKHWPEWMKARRTWLRDSNRDNSVFEQGSITVKGDERWRVGVYCRITRGSLTWECYIVAVQNTFAPFREFTTRLTFIRGTGFWQRTLLEQNPSWREGKRGVYD